MAGGIPQITLSNFTGIDFNQILQTILAADQIPIIQLQNEVAGENVAISALGTLSGEFSTLQQSLDALNSSLTFPPLQATSSAGAPFQASVSGAPLEGSFSVTVNQLASAQVTASQGFASDADIVGTGTITITKGQTSTDITIDSTNNTLGGVADAINAVSIGLTAQVINTGLPGSPFRLQISSNSSGAAERFSVATSLSGGTPPDFENTAVGTVSLDSVGGTSSPAVGGTFTGAVSEGFHFTVTSGGTVGTDPITIGFTSDGGASGTISVPINYSGTPLTVADGLTLTLSSGTLNQNDQFSVAAFAPVVSVARDATLQVGNQIITSASNQVTNAIPGLTLDLSATGGPATVTVGPDVAAQASLAEEFVKAFNLLAKDLQTQTLASPGQPPPPLANDGSVKAVRTSLLTRLGTVNLSKLGISIDDKSGQLSFDQQKFSDGLTSDPSGVSLATSGLFTALDPVVNGALAPSTGLIASETSSLEGRISDQNLRITNLTNQLDLEKQQLQQEFAQIQAQVAALQSLSQLFLVSSSSGANSAPPPPGSNLSILG